MNDFELIITAQQGQVAKVVTGRAPPDFQQEVCQDVFVRAFTSRKGFRGQQALSHWISTIAVRACRDFWRERYRRRETPLSHLSEDARDWLENTLQDDSGRDLEQLVQERQAGEILDWALTRLSPAERSVITLVHLEDKSVAEAADLPGFSAAKVEVCAFRGRRKLAGLLEEFHRTGQI